MRGPSEKIGPAARHCAGACNIDQASKADHVTDTETLSPEQGYRDRLLGEATSHAERGGSELSRDNLRLQAAGLAPADDFVEMLQHVADLSLKLGVIGFVGGHMNAGAHLSHAARLAGDAQRALLSVVLHLEAADEGLTDIDGLLAEVDVADIDVAVLLEELGLLADILQRIVDTYGASRNEAVVRPAQRSARPRRP